MEGCVESITFSNAKCDFPRHKHNNYQMIYIQKGEAMLRVDSREYLAPAPCLVFLSNLEQHSFEILSQDYERYTINIEPQEANRFIKNQTLLSIFSNRPPQFFHVLDVSPFLSKTDTIIKMMYEESCCSDFEYSEANSLLLKVLLIEIKRHFPDAFPMVNTGISNTIWLVKKDLEQQVEQDLSLTEIASRYNISPHYLAHSFKKITGYSTKQYQLLCRLSVARELLYSTELSISEVCQKAGFSDMSNFSRYFRRYMGTTPTSYRKQLQTPNHLDIPMN